MMMLRSSPGPGFWRTRAFKYRRFRGCDAAIQEIENGLQPDLILQLNDVVRDKAAAIALGKAFFWEMQFGSDGFTACATCHFNAGADSRTMNQADPGLRRVDNNGNPSADSTIFHPGFGPNHQLSVSDFPLHKLADITRSNSAALSDNNNIVGSQGVLRNNFNYLVLGLGPEDETSVADPVWFITDPSGAPLNVRRSTPRNAPPVINAVFNYRNFWDGRAQNTFNGVDNMNREIFEAVDLAMNKSTGGHRNLLDTMIVARNLERVADHATNIAEDVIFWVRGADVRHHAQG
jgi:hypothetical protein